MERGTHRISNDDIARRLTGQRDGSKARRARRHIPLLNCNAFQFCQVQTPMAYAVTFNADKEHNLGLLSYTTRLHRSQTPGTRM
jgi:hypothetical protein